MKVSRASRKGEKHFYLVALKPEVFALGLYCVILSILVANLLWINVLYLCSSLELLDMDYLLNQLIYIHLVFAVATSYVWWQLSQDRGKSILTHVMFFVWHGSKLFAASLEICSFFRFFDKLVLDTPKEDMARLTTKLTWGFVGVGMVECFGFFLAYKYLRRKANKVKTQQAHQVPVLAA